MLDSAPERNRLLATLISHHGDLVVRQSRGNEDDLQDLLLKLLSSSPDLLAPIWRRTRSAARRQDGRGEGEALPRPGWLGAPHEPAREAREAPPGA